MHYGSPHNGNGMRTTMGRTTPRRRTAGRGASVRRTTPRATTSRTGRVMRGGTPVRAAARGLRRMTGPMGRGGITRRATTVGRPAPIIRRNRTQPMMRNQTSARGIMNNSGNGVLGFRGVTSDGRNF